jgi:hypothetical protein
LPNGRSFEGPGRWATPGHAHPRPRTRPRSPPGSRSH